MLPGGLTGPYKGGTLEEQGQEQRKDIDMIVTASELGKYIGKPVGVMDGFDAFGGELMGVEKVENDQKMKVVLFYEDEIDIRTYILTMDLDKQVDILED